MFTSKAELQGYVNKLEEELEKFHETLEAMPEDRLTVKEFLQTHKYQGLVGKRITGKITGVEVEDALIVDVGPYVNPLVRIYSEAGLLTQYTDSIYDAEITGDTISIPAPSYEAPENPVGYHAIVRETGQRAFITADLGIRFGEVIIRIVSGPSSGVSDSVRLDELTNFFKLD